MSTQKITVSYEIDVEVDDLSNLRKEFERSVPGSHRRAMIYELCKQRRQRAIARLEGEAIAHLNIGKRKLDDLFKLDNA